MTVIFPEATKAQGNKSVVVIQTVADPTAPKLATEINAATSVNASFYFYGGFNPTAEPNKGSAPSRLADTVEREEFGKTKFSIGDLSYVVDPQGEDTDEPNLLKAALPEGGDIWILERRGLNAKTAALATTQKVRMHHVTVGPQVGGETSEDEFAEFNMTQSVMYVEPPVDGVIAA